MAETTVTGVIDRLVQLLTEEERLFKGVNAEVQSVKLDLEIIRSFLKDAEARSDIFGDTSNDVKAWVTQACEVAQQIENSMDKYLLHMAGHRHRQRGGFVNFLRKTGYFIKALKQGPDIASEIQKIKTSLDEMKSTSARYGFSPAREGPSRKLVEIEMPGPRLRSLSFEEDKVAVGLDSTSKEVVGVLVDGASSRSVISLVGMGGIGKTTLAKKVYDHKIVQRHFDCHAWVSVSQSFNRDRLLRVLMQQICPAVEHDLGETNASDEIIYSLRQYLRMKRYIVVFDDVWDENFLLFMQHGFPDNGKGSRLLITSRLMSVARSFPATVHVYHVQPLPERIAWELFCKKTFLYEPEGCCPGELKELSMEIVRRCQGLPLLIWYVAGFLSTKEKTEFEWKRLLFCFNSQFEENPYLISVSKTLLLSYLDLSHQLQSCLLYFCIFPEGYLVPDVKLFKLWIAEGFIKNKEGDRTLEQVAEEYLSELIQRNLVQISYVNYHGFERLCKVHDILRHVLLSKANEISFCRILYGKNLPHGGKSRRLSICGGTGNSLEIPEDFNEVRCLFLFDIDELMSKAFVDTLFGRCKLLTMVDFENVPLYYIPDTIGNLLHLKYLSLRNTKVKILPKSVGKLENLLTLDLRSTLVEELPIEINKLRKLRQLLVSRIVERSNLSSTYGVGIREGIGRLENLETLMTVEANDRDIGLVEELGKLGKLSWLGVSKLTIEILNFLCTSIERMNHLQRLSLHTFESLDLQSISPPPPFLQNLILKGRLRMMPDWISKLQHLSVLGLSFSRLGDDPLKCLCHLPNLVFLSLYHAFNGDKLHFEEGGFQKLKVLVLRELHGLKALKIDKGALPLLEELQVGPSQLLDEVPSDIQHLGNLRVLAFYDMLRDFVLGMLPDEGSDYWKVKNIPSVVLPYRIRGRRYAVYKLGESDLLDYLKGLSGSTYIQWEEHRFSFFYSDDEDLASTSDVGWDDDQLSFFSDDIED